MLKNSFVDMKFSLSTAEAFVHLERMEKKDTLQVSISSLVYCCRDCLKQRTSDDIYFSVGTVGIE